MKKSNQIFSVFFGVLAFLELIGYFTGRGWCGWACILLTGLSIMFYCDSLTKTKGKEVTMR